MDASKLLSAAQRYFAAETNNAAWELAERASLADDERDRCVAAAYASLFHWSSLPSAGVETARAHCTVARALLVHGGEAAALARRHAELALAGATEGWERVFALATLARAQVAGGDAVTARATLGSARAALAAVSDDEDRAICERELSAGPWFGLA